MSYGKVLKMCYASFRTLSVTSQKQSEEFLVSFRKFMTRSVLLQHFSYEQKLVCKNSGKMGVNWDDELTPELQARWRKFFEELNEQNNVSFPRGLFSRDSIGLPILCIFADPCIYFCWKRTMALPRSVSLRQSHDLPG